MANGYIVWGNGTSTSLHENSFGFSPPTPPITYNGNTYLFSAREPVGAATTYLSAFKRINNIPSSLPYFTNLDAVNDPTAYNGGAQVYYPTSGGSLAYTAYVSTLSGALKLQTFNLANETWDTVLTTAGPIIQNNNFHLVRRTTGDWVVVYSSLNGPETLDIYFQVFDGTNWGTATIISNLSTGSNDLAIPRFIAHKPANNSIAIWWEQTYFSESYGTKHNYLTILNSANAIGTHYNWDNRTNAPVAWEVHGQPVYNPGEDAWDSPILEGSNTGNVPLCVAHHTPANSPNATTTHRIIGGANIDNVAFPRLAVDPYDNKLYFSWPNNYNGSGGNNQLLYISRVANGTSTWAVTTTTDQVGSALYIPQNMVYSPNTAGYDTIQKGSLTTVIYEAGVDTLYPTPTFFGNQWLDLMYFSVNTGIIKSVTNPNCDYQYYFQYSSNPPVLACPVSNTINLGTAHTGTMVRTGGIAPFTFTLLN